jgi:hypothetical protein
MKYNQPYGVSDPNAAYINGNPSTGTMGSIPPAASIEYPQREIVAAIQEAGLTGDNSDLTQLLKMLKIMDVFNKFKCASNGGSASQWSAAIPSLPIMPPPLGCTIWFHPGFDSVQGGTVFSVNGSPFAPVVNADGTPIGIGDVLAIGWVLLFFDGTHWAIVAGSSSRIPGVLPMLQRNADWYVNGTTGDDGTHDGTSPTVGAGRIGPFKTISRAAGETLKYNMNGYDQFIHIADGTYGGVNPIVLSTPNGAGSIHVIGNSANPAGVNITATVAQTNGITQNGGTYYYDGLRFTSAAGCFDGIAVLGGSANLKNVRFGPCTQFHISSNISGTSLILSGGTITIEAGANAQAHIFASSAGLLYYPGPQPPIWPVLNILGAVTFATAFVQSYQLGVLQMHYTSITGAASVTGPKYLATGNAVIDSGGGGANYFPGSTAGSVSTGGQYL